MRRANKGVIFKIYAVIFSKKIDSCLRGMGDEIRSENDYFSMTVIHTELCKGSLNK